ncbi:hypothetical protein Lesp02_08700 [Lentzea sp. NBRC 105346]|uniref:class I SAM-dependent methyltransferase n=1 Tax=Lentzea sp. NBRC 105346 TaxID=3032205 RepID=UPI0024A1AA7D|nr:class I SAM-dependent methyltransferase [Lentzea sp. NBRC 105346]GLZ28680.1 hypothetical protein Lesp02_08700 [Lentzea sp. NBRC 105346]
MSERMSERDYVPAMGKHHLTPLYDLVHHLSGLRRVHLEMIKLAELRGGHRVLDVGCGTGNLLRSIEKRHPDVDLTGLDPDPKALAVAARKVRRATLDRGFAQELPYPDGSFDRVFSSLMLHHLDSPVKDTLLAEVRRVLKPGGLLVLADAVAGHHHNHGPGRMRKMLHDNVGDAVSRRIAAAGYTVEPTRTIKLRIGPQIGIELAKPTS